MLLLAASLAGLANALVIGLASSIARTPEHAWPRWILFAVGVAVYAVCARRTYHVVVAIVESSVQRLRAGLVEKIGRCDLAGVERVGSAEIYDRITQTTASLSGVAGVLAYLLQSLGVLVFAVAYVAWLSPNAYVLIVALIAVFARLYVLHHREVRDHLGAMARRRVEFLDRLTDLMRGFKESKLSRVRSAELGDAIVRTSDALRATSVKFNTLVDMNSVLVGCSLLVMLGVVVFVLPQHVATDSGALSDHVAAVMFLWAPLSGVVVAVPSYSRAVQALREASELAAKLDAGADATAAADGAADPWAGRVDTVALRRLCYAYPDAPASDPFSVGPIDLTLRAGEIVFFVGGNGSGKSTLLKALIGLYAPTGGGIEVDGVAVSAANVAAYRELFGVIFADFHLFSKLHGLDAVDETRVGELLADMQLTGRTAFAHDRFTRRDLSTGQRKRLALIVTLLEDRPILVFDEWAADQDPEFRRTFYDEILPALKRAGKLVLAVSHDDRYFHCADRVVIMDRGRVRSVETHTGRLPS
ncbi:cyclic peptide export ABC transporter [Nannocystis radixulma]|uniref:Cyclic peptide export ABC transporter n=1 Tax=Nannocystis radixulma TaxID=2995305 RepID=A0ABT5BEX8_9BACT|nr:cyclic peptide export ABC transporter [Nannocystis radixulma]MDC0671978.1 cyclic peptide export ABC transporter [Nannocystis radixulma]